MPPKGKQGTKGQKQILEENRSTLNFYLYIISGCNIVYFLCQWLFFWDSFTTRYVILNLLTTGIYLGSYKFMSFMSRATFDPTTGSLLDAGTDLNMEHGLAEHLKDMILLTAIVHVLTLFTNYFWFLLLLAPSRAFYMLWVNIIAPWIFAEAPEVDEKKNKKMERRMKRR